MPTCAGSTMTIRMVVPSSAGRRRRRPKGGAPGSRAAVMAQPDGEGRFLLALNAVHAVRKYMRGREAAAKTASRKRIMLASLAGGLYERAARQAYVGVFGVPNARSTHSFVRKQGLRLIRPLPVRACLPVPSWRGRVESFVDARFLQGDRFDAIVTALETLPVDRWVQHALTSWLRWRLSRPACPLRPASRPGRDRNLDRGGTRGGAFLQSSSSSTRDWMRRGIDGHGFSRTNSCSPPASSTAHRSRSMQD